MVSTVDQQYEKTRSRSVNGSHTDCRAHPSGSLVMLLVFNLMTFSIQQHDLNIPCYHLNK